MAGFSTVYGNRSFSPGTLGRKRRSPEDLNFPALTCAARGGVERSFSLAKCMILRCTNPFHCSRAATVFLADCALFIFYG